MSLVEPIRIVAFLHSGKEDMEQAAIDAVGKDVFTDFPIEVQRNLCYMLYEVEFEIAADPLTGNYRILSIKDGGDEYLLARLNRSDDNSN